MCFFINSPGYLRKMFVLNGFFTSWMWQKQPGASLLFSPFWKSNHREEKVNMARNRMNMPHKIHQICIKNGTKRVYSTVESFFHQLILACLNLNIFPNRCEEINIWIKKTCNIDIPNFTLYLYIRSLVVQVSADLTPHISTHSLAMRKINARSQCQISQTQLIGRPWMSFLVLIQLTSDLQN